MLAVIRCLVKACRELGIEPDFLDDNRNFVRVRAGGRPYYFINFTSPIGRQDILRICRDKAFTHRLIRDRIRTPRTRDYLDPLCRKEYRKYAPLPSHAAIIEDMTAGFEFPMVVKRNQGTRGRNVFLCRSRRDVENAVAAVFDPRTKTYDYVVLAQEWIPNAVEYRLIWMDGEIPLVYRKDTAGASFAGNLSPLHWEHARAVPADDPGLLKRFQTFLAPLPDILELGFSGLDILQDEAQRLWLLEINSQPDFALFIRDNGDDRIVTIYRRLLQRLQNRHYPDRRRP